MVEKRKFGIVKKFRALKMALFKKSLSKKQQKQQR